MCPYRWERNTVMSIPRSLDRRSFLRGAAVGAAGLALPAAGSALASSSRDVVKINFWGPGGDPLGGPIIKKMVDEFNAGVGKANGIFVNNNYVSTANHYLKYTTGMTSSSSPDVLFTYGYDPVIPWIANGFVLPLDAYA